MRLVLSALLATLLLPVVAAPASAQAGICQDLWVERNSIYKANGYCFKTARAIAYFGNGGCVYTHEASIPMSRPERVRIQQIVALERQYGCR